MIENNNLGSIMGAPVVGPDDERIGTVGVIFVDPVSNQPNWATVHTGLFGRHESFVPLDDAMWDREVLHITFAKDTVKDAPRIDTDNALGPEDEAELYRYYGRELPEPGEVAAVPAAESDRAGDAAAPAADEPAAAPSTAADSRPSARLRRYSSDDSAAASARSETPAAAPADGDGPRHRA